MKITDFTSTKLAEFDEKFSERFLRIVRFADKGYGFECTDALVRLQKDIEENHSRAITEAYLLGTIEAYDVLPSRKFEPFTPEEERMHLAISEKLAAIRKEIDGTV